MTTTLSIAFFAGLISFLSPCVLPLIPGYIAYISGTSLENLTEKKNNLEKLVNKETSCKWNKQRRHFKFHSKRGR